MIVNHATGGRLTPAFVDAVVRHSLENSDETAFGGYLESWARADILAKVKGNEVPVKVITGEYDPTQPAEFMEQAWLQPYPNSELEVLRGPATTRCSRPRSPSPPRSRSSWPEAKRSTPSYRTDRAFHRPGSAVSLPPPASAA